jgi:hypothetical protein
MAESRIPRMNRGERRRLARRDAGAETPRRRLAGAIARARLTSACRRPAVCTMGRALARLGARLGSPKPIVLCPWPRDQRLARLAELRRLEDRATAAEPVLFEDEVDIHLNPKIGRDWMLRGHQRKIVTPGKNEKFYLAGALDVLTGKLICTGCGAQERCAVLRLAATNLDFLSTRPMCPRHPRQLRHSHSSNSRSTNLGRPPVSSAHSRKMGQCGPRFGTEPSLAVPDDDTRRSDQRRPSPARRTKDAP